MRRFGELEAAVMDCVWRHGAPVSVREVLDDLNQERKLAYTTVLTVMDKLHTKGWLQRHRSGRAFAYEATRGREAYTARLMRDALSTSSNQAAAFVHFLSELTPDEAAALKSALQVVPPENR